MTDMKALDQKALAAEAAAIAQRFIDGFDREYRAAILAHFASLPAVAEAVEPVAHTCEENLRILHEDPTGYIVVVPERSRIMNVALYRSPPSPASSPKREKAVPPKLVDGLNEVVNTAYKDSYGDWHITADEGRVRKLCKAAAAALSPDLAVKVEAGKPDAP